MVGCHEEECQEGTWHPGGAKKSRLKRKELARGRKWLVSTKQKVQGAVRHKLVRRQLRQFSFRIWTRMFGGEESNSPTPYSGYFGSQHGFIGLFCNGDHYLFCS